MIRSATFALFTRSLREDTRRATPFFARMGLAAMILVFLAFAHASYSFRSASAPGLTFFGMVIWINAVFFSVVGLAHFSSAITEEKEEMTLGLLRMTNLNPLSILMGKSTNRLFVALLYLAAQFPFTLLAVSLGGVATGQIIAAYVALAAYVILLANVALFFSVICRRTYAAAFFTFISMLVSFLAIWLGYGVVSVLTGTGIISRSGGLAQIPETLAETTIWWRLTEIFRTGFTGGPFCSQVITNIGAAAALFFVSWLVFNKSTRNQLGDDGGPGRPAGTARIRSRDKTGRRRMFTPPRPGPAMAVFWKDWHFIHSGYLGLLVRCLLLFAIFFVVIPGLAFLFDYRSYSSQVTLDDFLIERETLGFSMFWVSALLLVLQLTVLAGRIFRTEIQWKTLSSIAMLPVSMRRIAYEKTGAALVASLPSFGCMLLGLLIVSDELQWEINRMDGEEFFYLGTAVLFCLSQVLLAVHVISLLSLHLKWGAFALGLFAIFVANMGFFMFAAMASINSEEGVFGMMFLAALGAIGISAALHAAIGKGLESAAARE